MNKRFNVGDILYGFCNGYFGSSDYDTKICVFVAEKFAVFVYIEGDFKGNATVLNNHFSLEQGMIEKWKFEPEQ
jgi:hypothetical protein